MGGRRALAAVSKVASWQPAGLLVASWLLCSHPLLSPLSLPVSGVSRLMCIQLMCALYILSGERMENAIGSALCKNGFKVVFLKKN